MIINTTDERRGSIQDSVLDPALRAAGARDVLHDGGRGVGRVRWHPTHG